jgi:hypothetical protein
MAKNSQINESGNLKNKSIFIDTDGAFCLPEKTDFSLQELLSEFEKIDLSYDVYYRGGVERGTIDPELKEIYIKFLKAVLTKKLSV